jgi:nucleoside-diphosphate-sugar epimerase
MECGHDVLGLDTGYYRDGWLFQGVKRFPKWLHKDIRHITGEDLRGFDAVVHLAELSNDPLGQLHPEITYQINHHGSVN